MVSKFLIVKLLEQLDTDDILLRRQTKHQIQAEIPQVQDKAAIKAISRLLLHSNEEVRSESAYVLSRIGSALPVPQLIKTMESDSSYEVRCSAAEALGKIGDKVAITPLLKIFESPVQTLGDVRLHWHIAEALGFMSEIEVIRPLLAALLNDYGALEPACSDLRQAIVEAISVLGNESTAELLIETLDKLELLPWTIKNDSKIGWVCDILGDLEYPIAIEPLIKILNTIKYGSRSAAADALGHFNDSRCVEALQSVLDSDNLGLVRCAAMSLTRLGYDVKL